MLLERILLFAILSPELLAAQAISFERVPIDHPLSHATMVGDFNGGGKPDLVSLQPGQVLTFLREALRRSVLTPATLLPRISTLTVIWTLQSPTDTAASPEEAFLFCLEMAMALSGKCRNRSQTLPRTGLPMSTAMACPTLSREQISFSAPELFC